MPPTSINLSPGKIVLLLGPSGSGKSSALAAIDEHFAGARRVDRVTFPLDRSIIDHLAPDRPLDAAVAWLTACGLSEPRLWLRRFSELSEGERFRARLAFALAHHNQDNAPAPILCDEFAAALHDRMAQSVSFNLQKLVARHGLRVVLATTRDDLVPYIRPHEIVRLAPGGHCVVEQASLPARTGCPLLRRLTITPGTKRDYDAFAAMHYRVTDELGFVDRVFVVRERGGDREILAIVVYAHGPLELALRNDATDRRFVKRPDRLNQEVRMLRRLVVHPDVRGCGVGHWLVRRTMPLLGVRFVECLAGLGAFNPVFEKAGMRRVGQCAMPDRCRAVLDHLRRLDVDPADPQFPQLVAARRDVRELVARAVRDWYVATTAAGDTRLAHHTPETLARTFRGLIDSRPVYYLWERKTRARLTDAARPSLNPIANGNSPRRRSRPAWKFDPDSFHDGSAIRFAPVRKRFT